MTEEDIKRMAKEAGFSDGEVDYCQSIIIHLAILVAKQEREACVKAIEAQIGWDMDDPESTAIEAIRARGQA
jgi:hypothetical protein